MRKLGDTERMDELWTAFVLTIPYQLVAIVLMIVGLVAYEVATGNQRPSRLMRWGMIFLILWTASQAVAVLIIGLGLTPR